MRGLFTAGVLDALYEAGIRFDGIIGVSAGAAFGCNYKSHQPGRVLRYNLRFCRDRRYWGFGSLLRTGDLFNADFCYRTLPRILDPWNGAAFEADPTRFWVVATDVDTGEPVYPELASADDRAFDWIQASSSMPIVSRPVTIDGHRYLDGGLSDSIPLAKFQSLGFARNVVILTRPASYRKKPSRTWTLLHPFLCGLPAVKVALATRAERYNRTVECVKAEETKGTVFAIRPDAELPIGRVTRSRADIQTAYKLGRAAAGRALDSLREWMGNSHSPVRRAFPPPEPPPRKSAGRIALALYAVFLFSIAVWRPWKSPVPPFSGSWQIVPFTGLGNLWRSGIVPFTFFFVGNVACFLPFGFWIPKLTSLRRSVVPLCLVGSLLIETLQWAFGTGSSQTEDILLNTLGGALGHALFRVLSAPPSASSFSEQVTSP